MRDHSVRIRMSESERAAIETLARDMGVTVSDTVRALVAFAIENRELIDRFKKETKFYVLVPTRKFRPLRWGLRDSSVKK